MRHHARHRVVAVGLGIVRLALADLVDGDDPALLRETVEVQVPVGRAVRAVMRSEIAAVEQHHELPRSIVEITRPDTVDIDELRL